MFACSCRRVSLRSKECLISTDSPLRVSCLRLYVTIPFYLYDQFHTAFYFPFLSSSLWQYKFPTSDTDFQQALQNLKWFRSLTSRAESFFFSPRYWEKTGYSTMQAGVVWNETFNVSYNNFKVFFFFFLIVFVSFSFENDVFDKKEPFSVITNWNLSLLLFSFLLEFWKMLVLVEGFKEINYKVIFVFRLSPIKW